MISSCDAEQLIVGQTIIQNYYCTMPAELLVAIPVGCKNTQTSV